MLLKEIKGCSGNGFNGSEKSFMPTMRAQALGDLRAVDHQVVIPRRVAASATRFQAGEPLHGLGVLTSGVIDVTTFVLAAADTPVVGTHRFGGIAERGALPDASGTLTAQVARCYCPIPWLGLMEGRAETVASVDTESELIGVTGDAVLIDYNATGAADGGELYTIKEVASADTSGLEIGWGDTAKGLLQVFIDGRAYRNDIS